MNLTSDCCSSIGSRSKLLLAICNATAEDGAQASHHLANDRIRVNATAEDGAQASHSKSRLLEDDRSAKTRCQSIFEGKNT